MKKTKKKKPKVKDVRGDIIARLQREADAWELVIAKHGHPFTLAQRLEEYMTALDEERKEKEENKVALAGLFRDVRDTIDLEEEFDGVMPLLVRLKTMAMPAFMIRQSAKLTKKKLWQKVTVLLNNFVYDRYHGSLSSVTTVKKSPNTPRQPTCGNGGWCVKPPDHEGKCVPEMCSGYPNYNGCGKPHGHEGMCIPGEPGYIRPKAILPGDCCGDD